LTSEVLARTAVTTLVAVCGGIVGLLATGGAKDRLSALIGIASGALLAITLVSLLPEAAHDLSPVALVLSVALGYFLFYLVGRYISPVCPACAEHEIEERINRSQSLSKNALLLGIALSLHSIADGVAVSAGHGGTGSHAQESLPMLLAISLHKLPEGLALVTLLLSAGIGRGMAFWATVLVESTTLLGGFVSQSSFFTGSPLAFGFLNAHLAGSFLYLVLHSLSGTPSTPTLRRVQGGYGLLGFGSVTLLLLGVRFLGLGDSH
jgi:zinc and cadmium transporter